MDADAAVRAIWARRRGEVLARVDVVDEAVAALRAGELPEELREHAQREVHKLAGSAGMFGFARSSALARKLEQALETGPEPADAGPLSEWAHAIRAELTAGDEGAGGLPRPDAAPLVLVCGPDPERGRELVREHEARGMRALFAEPATAVPEAVAHAPAAVLVDAGEAVAAATLELIMRLSTGGRGSQVTPAPLLVLAGEGNLAERVEMARAGARRVLPATLAADRIAETVLRVIEGAREARPRVAALDDDEAIGEAVSAILGEAGVAVSVTQDPDQLWEWMRADRPDLVILDVDMPGADGIELCQVIRTEAELADLPVLFLTGRGDPETLRRIFAAGADDYVPKPIVPVVLSTRVRNRLERARLQRELSERDQLTALLTRPAGAALLERMLASAREAGDPVTVAIVDVDRFKRINDNFGHAAGDRVLRGVADVLRTSFRAEDVVARWGGEEFLVGFQGVPAEVGRRRVEEALQRLRAEGVPGAGEAGAGVTFSAGVAQLGRDGDGLEPLCAAADEALYRAKAAGRGRVLEAER